MAKGTKTGGRKKGTPNKISSTVKDNVISVFNDIGGAEGMVLWAKDNRTEFYKLYAKLLPTELSGPDGSAIPVGISITFVNASKS